jgi:hypothetical protein
MNTRQLTAIQIPAIDLTGNGGLGWDDLKDPHKGVAMFAVMPPGMANGDYVELFWNGQVIQKFLLDPDLPSLDFSVLPQDIPDEPDISEVFYRIAAAAGSIQEDSPVRQVQVKRSVPGDPDPDYHTPYINENLAPLENLPSDIDIPVDLSLTVPAWHNMHEGDVLRVFWGSIQSVAENPPLPRGEEGKPQIITVTAALQRAAGNHENLVVNYEVRDLVNNWSLYSLAAFTNVNLLTTPAPTVSEAPDDVLDPLLVLTGATVEVAYPGILGTDEIRVRWDGHEDVTDPVTQPGNPAGSVQFALPPAALAPVLGKTVEVRYVVTRGGRQVESDALSLTVQALPDSSLPSPKITQASNKTLNVSRLEEDVDLSVPAWPFIAPGQQVWLRFEGTREDGSAHNWNHPVWQDFAIAAATDQSTTVALGELQKLKNDTSLRLIMEVSFDGGKTRTPLPIETLTLIVYYPISGTESWETFPLQALPTDGEPPVPCSYGSHLRTWRVASISNVGTTYPAFGNRTLELGGDSNIMFFCAGFIGTLSVSHARAESDENLVKFYSANDAEIVRAKFKSSTQVVTQTITVSQPCLYFRIILAGNLDSVLVDNLIWTAWKP